MTTTRTATTAERVVPTTFFAVGAALLLTAASTLPTPQYLIAGILAATGAVLGTHSRRSRRQTTLQTLALAGALILAISTTMLTT